MKWISLFSIVLSSLAFAGDKTGNGGDPVETVFAKAQQEAIKVIESIDPRRIKKLPLSEPSKGWLKSNFPYFKLYLGMRLKFQNPPCVDENGLKTAVCFGFDDSNFLKPTMTISLDRNKNTTIEQAEELVFHEAGHLAGEPDHVLLSNVGAELTALPAKMTMRHAEPCRHYSEASLRAASQGFECETAKHAVFRLIKRTGKGKEIWLDTKSGLLITDILAGTYNGPEAGLDETERRRDLDLCKNNESSASLDARGGLTQVAWHVPSGSSEDLESDIKLLDEDGFREVIAHATERSFWTSTRGFGFRDFYVFYGFSGTLSPVPTFDSDGLGNHDPNTGEYIANPDYKGFVASVFCVGR